MKTNIRILDLFRISILVFSIFILAGCSRTVTTMPTFGNELNIEITLGASADVINNRYFVIFSTMESYQIPLPPPDSQDEFLEPGSAPQPGAKSISDYFSQYYSTWSSYVVIDSQGYSLVNGPFIATNAVTRELISGLGTVTNKLAFTVRLDRLFGATLPKQLYIDVIAASYPQNSLKVLKDRISPPTNNFEPIKGTVISKSDETSSDLNSALDILSWKISLP
ncbi:hypothetical protein HZC34_07670 [Candidatus Saganbacteria bacterium]|nr:hypothetical protein [Candidatus Saganbacteria bacterium]